VVAAFRHDPIVLRWLGEADIVEIQWAEYLRMVPAIRAVNRHAPIGVVEHDVAIEALSRRARSARSRKERGAARVRLHFALRQEPALINQCDVAYVFKEADAELLIRLGVTTPVGVLDPYLQAPETPIQARKSGSVLFVGALSRPENWEGLDWFLDQVWPKVLGELAHASLVIAGADPPEQLQRRAGRSVTVTGWVDSIDPFYKQAMVFVAPVFSGAGLRFKVPQAMLYGLPVVGTTLALEGVSPPAPRSAIGGVVDDADAMAGCISQLLANPELAGQIGSRARQWAAQRYSFQRTVHTALSEYAALVSPAGRLAGAGPTAGRLPAC
jgi:glycosyltransferase involved in cell wall biosynthesis